VIPAGTAFRKHCQIQATMALTGCVSPWGGVDKQGADKVAWVEPLNASTCTLRSVHVGYLVVVSESARCSRYCVTVFTYTCRLIISDIASYTHIGLRSYRMHDMRYSAMQTTLDSVFRNYILVQDYM